MAMAAEEIERLVKEALPDSQVVIVDLAGDGDHYAARITSEAFRGKSRVQQHQMVYAALQGNMGGALHALKLETLAPK
ncbi:BolA/IbaG family iron-sulfur metabolism protein [Xanthobacter oligotrophicus]|uniref:BolA/IbaG family iron-sulfur metabolism protein n=1 Tax=Xanthobacter oligotrophicus TaxID=2607286 RepID=UPI0011F3DF97|nr:BolA family transcriptional regulator [Xanthobacter oligotrophicus]MCG5235206.1 BolA family transcriptional regulator [Xanthobacter oligotrophicus]